MLYLNSSILFVSLAGYLLSFRFKKSEMVFVNDEKLFCARKTEIRICSVGSAHIVIDGVSKVWCMCLLTNAKACATVLWTRKTQSGNRSGIQTNFDM